MIWGTKNSNFLYVHQIYAGIDVFNCILPSESFIMTACVFNLFQNIRKLGWNLAIARYQLRPCGQQGSFAPTFFLELILLFISAIYPSYQWFLKLSVTQRNEITDRTHTRFVSFIITDLPPLRSIEVTPSIAMHKVAGSIDQTHCLTPDICSQSEATEDRSRT